MHWIVFLDQQNDDNSLFDVVFPRASDARKGDKPVVMSPVRCSKVLENEVTNAIELLLLEFRRNVRNEDALTYGSRKKKRVALEFNYRFHHDNTHKMNKALVDVLEFID